MAWAVVQSAGSSSNTAGSLTVTLGSTPTAGNIIVAYATVNVASGSVSISSVKDGASTALTAVKTLHTATTLYSGIYAYNAVASANGKSITANFSVSSGNGFSMVVEEVSGVATPPTADGTFGALEGGTSPISPTYSSTASNEFLVVYGSDSGPGGISLAISGYTLDSNSQNASANASSVVGRKNSTGGSETTALSWSGGDNPVNAIAGAFKLPSAAVAAPPPAVVPARRRGLPPRYPKRGQDFIGPQIIPPNPQLWWSHAPARRWRGFLVRKGRTFDYPQTIPPPGPPVLGFIAWYDASQITNQADNTALATWPDLSPSGFHLRATGTAQPTYYSSTQGKTVNGLPAVWFNGSTNWMQSAAFGANLAQPNTIFIVTQNTVGSGNVNVLDGGSSRGGIVGISPTNNFYMNAGASLQDGHSDSNFHVFTAVYNGASSTFTVDSSFASGNANTTVLNGITFSGTPSHTALWTGPICEVIYYHSGLSLADQQSVQTYLRNKWFNSWTPEVLPPKLRPRTNWTIYRRGKAVDAPLTQAAAPPPPFPPNINTTRRRGLLVRKERAAEVVPPQAPPGPPQIVPARRWRGFLVRKEHSAEVPLTQTAPVPPSFLPNAVNIRRRGIWVRNRQRGRDFVGPQIIPPNPNIAWSIKPRLRGLLVRKGRSNETPLQVPAPIPVSRPRLRGVPVRRGQTREVPLTQQPPPPPVFPPVNVRPRLRGLLVRKFKEFFWWPNQAPPPPPPNEIEITVRPPDPYWIMGHSGGAWETGTHPQSSDWTTGSPQDAWTVTQAGGSEWHIDQNPASDWQTGTPRT